MLARDGDVGLCAIDADDCFDAHFLQGSEGFVTLGLRAGEDLRGDAKCVVQSFHGKQLHIRAKGERG